MIYIWEFIIDKHVWIHPIRKPFLCNWFYLLSWLFSIYIHNDFIFKLVLTLLISIIDSLACNISHLWWTLILSNWLYPIGLLVVLLNLINHMILTILLLIASIYLKESRFVSFLELSISIRKLLLIVLHLSNAFMLVRILSTST